MTGLNSRGNADNGVHELRHCFLAFSELGFRLEQVMWGA